ncbi:cation diffusion facilitator family transporter [Psychrobacter sp. PP-21]|uniref:cation diffusion facilitator family transporter n=1 Tax=Psychrobacter sp. PP-21 TaxID=2957503 RepID=UPI0029A6F0F3|nr:cation diffusion facilitator family transporter [Psychrobacter sp. PP-21]MDX2373220.1 cation diffusion facilitator family transporter [Psychrobacter sp. PP-21]
MSLKPSIANPQRHLSSSPKAQPSRARGASHPKVSDDTSLNSNTNNYSEINDEHSGSLVTVLIAVGANLIIAIAKSVAAFMTGSASMIAEAAHSWADAGNGTLLIVAEKKSIKPADKSHPLGYGKESYVWSMIAAFGVFTAGSIVSIYTGIKEWNATESETNYTVAFIVLAVAFVLEGFSLIQAYRQSKKHGEALDISAIGYVVDTSNPTLRGVFFEDLAAVVGLVIAAAAMGMHAYTGEPYWDALGSIIVGLLLGAVAIFLISRNRDFLVGHRVAERMHEYVLGELLNHPDIDSVSYLHLEWVGPKKMFMVAAVDIKGNQKEEQIAQKFEEIENLFRANPIFQEAILTLSVPNAELLSLDKNLVG